MYYSHKHLLKTYYWQFSINLIYDQNNIISFVRCIETEFPKSRHELTTAMQYYYCFILGTIAPKR